MSSEHIRPQPTARYKFKKIENIPILRRRYYSNADVRRSWCVQSDSARKRLFNTFVRPVCVQCARRGNFGNDKLMVMTQNLNVNRICRCIFTYGRAFSVVSSRLVSFATMQPSINAGHKRAEILQHRGPRWRMAVASNANTFPFGCACEAQTLIRAQITPEKWRLLLDFHFQHQTLHRVFIALNTVVACGLWTHSINCWPIYSVYKVNSMHTHTHIAHTNGQNPDDARFMVDVSVCVPSNIQLLFIRTCKL